MWLRNWLECNLTQPFSLTKERDAARILYTSQHIARNPSLLKTLNDATLQHRLQKFALYTKAVTRVIQLATKQPKPTRFRFEPVSQSVFESYFPRAEIDIQDYFSPNLAIGALSPPIEVYNRLGLGSILEYEAHTPESIIKNAPQVTEDLASSPHECLMTAHCECVLVLSMISKENGATPLEIGLSKASCWPCITFLEELSSIEKKSIFISSTNNKTYGGWQFPSTIGQHQPIRLHMINQTEKRIVEFLKNVEAQRMSDSQYVSSNSETEDDLDAFVLLSINERK